MSNMGTPIFRTPYFTNFATNFFGKERPLNESKNHHQSPTFIIKLWPL